MAGYLIPCIWVAGGLQLLVASANFFAKRMFRYRENLAKVDPVFNAMFLAAFVYLASVFAWAALRPAP